MILKKAMNTTARPFTKKPDLPIQKGPGGIFFRPDKRCGAIARRYDVVLRMIKDPAKS